LKADAKHRLRLYFWLMRFGSKKLNLFAVVVEKTKNNADYSRFGGY